MSGAAARDASVARRRRLTVLFQARWGRSLRHLSLALWVATALSALLLGASLAEWIPTGDDSWTLMGAQFALLLASVLADGRRRRHVMRILGTRTGRGIVIETQGLFGPIHRDVSVEEMALIEVGAPDMNGVMTLRLPGQAKPYSVDTAGEELDIGLDAIPRPDRLDDVRSRAKRRRR
jgi:hypothetical protein